MFTGKLNTPVRQPMHLGQRVFHAKVTEKNSTGYTIETVIDGKHLRGILFSNKPNILSSVANTSNRYVFLFTNFHYNESPFWKNWF